MAFIREFLLISLALFGIFDAAVVKPKWQGRIIGGYTAEKDQLPYMVGIFQSYSGNIACGGALLNNRTILTSASCIEGHQRELNKLIAILGTPTPESENPNSFRVKVDRITLHDKYDSKTRAFDLAVLRTKKQITFSHAINSIALPTFDFDEQSDLAVVVSGWGLVEEPVDLRFKKAERLQVLHTTAISHDKCLNEFVKIAGENSEWNIINEQLTENNVCTLNPNGAYIGIGDGGSPLVSNGEIVGVASRIMGFGVPDVYSKVYPHLDWIQTEMDRNMKNLV